MAVWSWIKNKYQHRRAEKESHDPWWVTLMLDVGRPLVAILILVMCAPGEHYLAVQAGWSDMLAWGMPGTLTAYAGIAAVVATKRKKGAPGRKTAISGAVISIALAMAAQPIAHLYGRAGLHPEQVALTIAAGLIPAAVFGHLLHMGAAAPKPVRPEPVVEVERADTPDKPPVPPWVSEELSRRSELVLSGADSGVVPASELSVSSNGHPDMITWTGQPDTDKGNHGHTDDVLSEIAPVAVVRPRPANVRSIKKGTLSADVRAYLSEHPDASDEDLAAAMSIKWPDAKWDSVRKARDRYQEKRTS